MKWLIRALCRLKPYRFSNEEARDLWARYGRPR